MSFAGKRKYSVRFHKYKNGEYMPEVKHFEDELENVIKCAKEMMEEMEAKSIKIFDELGALIHQITDRENIGYAY